jgi:hypothetical protein
MRAGLGTIDIVTPAANLPQPNASARDYYRIGQISQDEGRWIGRCKTCQKTSQLEGRNAHAHYQTRSGGVQADTIVLAPDGRAFTCSSLGTDPSRLWVHCGTHWVLLRRVFEGKKHSKHECGARCTNATGPSCDCRCKGKNHGSNC